MYVTGGNDVRLQISDVKYNRRKFGTACLTGLYLLTLQIHLKVG